MDAMLFKLTDKDFKGFDKSILQTESPIRYSFVFLALTTHEKLKNLFKEYKTNDDFIEKIISPNIWGLSCLTSDLSCGVAWNSLWMGVLVGAITPILG